MKRNPILRKRLLERDQGICAVCGKFDPKWEGDHTVAIWSGGKDALDNLQTLCRRHHLEKSVGETPVRAKTDRLKERHDLTKKRREIRA
jgi:5-methylcytosine-specific restriction endonuclease McrA